jgi:hypothetical protein
VEGRGFGLIREYYPGNCPNFLRKLTKSSVRLGGSLGRGLKWESPKYEPGQVTIRRRRWVSYMLNNWDNILTETYLTISRAEEKELIILRLHWGLNEVYMKPQQESKNRTIDSTVLSIGNAIALYPGYRLFESRPNYLLFSFVPMAQPGVSMALSLGRKRPGN